jgi:hypothetical protein
VSASAVRRAATYVAAAMLVVSGIVHLRLYSDGYRDFPNENLGRSFLLNAIACAVVAVVLLVHDRRWPRSPDSPSRTARSSGSRSAAPIAGSSSSPSAASTRRPTPRCRCWSRSSPRPRSSGCSPSTLGMPD